MTRKVVEHIHTLSKRVRHANGTLYEALVLGERRDDGTWAGWLEFHALNDAGTTPQTNGGIA